MGINVSERICSRCRKIFRVSWGDVSTSLCSDCDREKDDENELKNRIATLTHEQRKELVEYLFQEYGIIGGF